MAWRAFSTGPDADVLIGDRFKPFYEADRVKDLGVSTWPSDHWKIGGGSVWGWLSYDPELDLVYHGTGNPGPWNPDVRPGDNKWSTALFARDPDDGQAVWAYQWSPHDLYDYDGINEMILTDQKVGGKDTPLLTHFDRNGFGYTLNRATGELLVAEKFDPVVNWASKVDMDKGSKTYGRPVVAVDRAHVLDAEVGEHALGGHVVLDGRLGGVESVDDLLGLAAGVGVVVVGRRRRVGSAGLGGLRGLLP